ncbi:Rap/Ran GTPase-activating protein [Entamoeba marina]
MQKSPQECENSQNSSSNDDTSNSLLNQQKPMAPAPPPGNRITTSDNQQNVPIPNIPQPRARPTGGRTTLRVSQRLFEKDRCQTSNGMSSSMDSRVDSSSETPSNLSPRYQTQKNDTNFEISEPTGFNQIINVNVENPINPLAKFDGKLERAILPLSPPLTLLNKRDITSPQQYFSLIDEMNKMQLLFDEWSSPIVPSEKWLMDYKKGWGEKSLIFPEVIKDGYCIEIGKRATTRETDLKTYTIVDITSDFGFFEKYIANNPNAEHYVLTNEPTALSVIPGYNGGFRKGIVMSKKGSIRCLIPNEITKMKDFKPAFPELSTGNFFKVSDKEKFEKEVVRYEQMSVITHYKFGVLYVKEHQTDENEMFGNTDNCPAFDKFMNLMGQKVELLGFDKYRGGLDVRNGSTGEHSYFTNHHCFEIMYHVSTMLPEQPGDLQRVEKKRHIGNDIVVIIFKENSNDPADKFNPLWLASQFNHIFIVVQPDNNSETNDGYTITVGCKSSVNPFAPFMSGDHFDHSPQTRDFILNKAINGERTAMFSPAFRGNTTKTRREQLRLLLESVE